MARQHATFLAFVILSAACLLNMGCTKISYTTPGPGADMRAFGVTPADQRDKLTDAQVRRELELKPLATFPANLCLARVQANQYKSYANQGYGRGAYSVITTRDVVNDKHLQTLRDLPMVAGVAAINRILVPEQLNSDMDLRQAAAKLHAQVLLIYTLDTDFYEENNASPADVVTFGFGNHKKIRITSTASAALLDVRNGYVYGIAEATSQHEQSTSSWNSKKKADESRRLTETEAFDQLVTELTHTWKGIIETYANPAAAAATGM